MSGRGEIVSPSCLLDLGMDGKGCFGPVPESVSRGIRRKKGHGVFFPIILRGEVT